MKTNVSKFVLPMFFCTLLSAEAATITMQMLGTVTDRQERGIGFIPGERVSIGDDVSFTVTWIDNAGNFGIEDRTVIPVAQQKFDQIPGMTAVLVIGNNSYSFRSEDLDFSEINGAINRVSWQFNDNTPMSGPAHPNQLDLFRLELFASDQRAPFEVLPSPFIPTRTEQINLSAVTEISGQMFSSGGGFARWSVSFEGQTLTIVPEPSSTVLLLLSVFAYTVKRSRKN